MTETIDTRDTKIKEWFLNIFWKDKTNLLLVIIILMALAIRVFFFMQTTSAGQTMWWDESSYMAQAVHYAYGTPYDVQSMIQRPPGFQYIAAIGMGMGLNENWIIFLLSLLPSVILIPLVFILGRSLFNNRIGLIAAAFLSVTWNFIFWSNRAQPDFLSICCQVLAIYYFWEMLKKKSEDSNASVTTIAILAGIWSAAGFYFKISSLLIPLAFLIYILIKDKLKIFIKKEYWIYGISYIITLVPYFIWAYSTFNDIFAFR
jgi:4-amino-4-deoxy-L-arabinose transferase-like glycosyltransferase